MSWKEATADAEGSSVHQENVFACFVLDCEVVSPGKQLLLHCSARGINRIKADRGASHEVTSNPEPREILNEPLRRRWGDNYRAFAVRNTTV
jgi:hypothetical protein